MSIFIIRITAMLTMLIDHLGLVFIRELPNELYVLTRVIGRISMPLFCFLIAEGLFHTSSAKRYLLRLAVFAVISEVPFDLMLYGVPFNWGGQNVGFTLLLGLMAILLYDSFAARNSPALALAAPLAAGALAVLISSDYNAFGVYYIFVFYYFRGHIRPLTAAFGIGVLLLSVTHYLSDRSWSFALATIASMGAIIPVAMYNGEKGLRLPKMTFYAFYPAHMLILAMIIYFIKV